MRVILYIVSFVLIVTLETLFHLEPLSLFVGVVFGAAFILFNYEIEIRRKGV